MHRGRKVGGNRGRKGEERVRVFTGPLLKGNYSYCFVSATDSYFRKKLTTSCVEAPALVKLNSTAIS